MPVLEAVSVTLEVPRLEEGIKFYTDAGLKPTARSQSVAYAARDRPSDAIVLLGGAPRKRLHHITLRADRLEEIAGRTPSAGGTVVEGSAGGIEENALWVRDPNGMLIHLVEIPKGAPLATAPAFEINGPGRLVRKGRSAMQASSTYPPIRPLRLGHILLFSPDVTRSVSFVVDALGMGLADRAQDVIAFLLRSQGQRSSCGGLRQVPEYRVPSR